MKTDCDHDLEREDCPKLIQENGVRVQLVTLATSEQRKSAKQQIRKLLDEMAVKIGMY